MIHFMVSYLYMIKVLLVLLIALPVHAQLTPQEKEEQAISHFKDALYKQTGLEEMTRKFIEREVPKKYRDTLERITPVVTTIVTRRMDFKWNY